MKAVDINILARFFINNPDDTESQRQQGLAIAVMAQPDFVPVTVLLEFEWVMRGFYRLSRADIRKVLEALTGFGHVVIEDRERVLAALKAFGDGMDFADALHVARSSHCRGLVTFDRKFARKAEGMGVSVEVPGEA